MSTSRPIFEHSVHTADEWLRSVARAFGTDDLNFAQRALRAWLHGLRDELPVETGARFAAQLPELLRGTYYEGWEPRHVPAQRDLDAFVERFAGEALVRPSEVGHVAATVTTGLREHLSADFLGAVLQQLPHRLRQLLATPAEAKDTAVAADATSETPDDRYARLEQQVLTLTEAVRELILGLEPTPLGPPSEHAMAEAAHRAHQILLSATRSGTQPDPPEEKAMTTARDIMHPGAECIGTHESLERAAIRMRELDVGALPVCGDDDRLHGIITDRDIVIGCIAAGHDPHTMTAGDLTQGSLFTADADAEVGAVLQTMQEHQIRRLPVIDQHRLVGMISEADLARHLSDDQVAHFVEAICATSG